MLMGTAAVFWSCSADTLPQHPTETAAASQKPHMAVCGRVAGCLGVAVPDGPVKPAPTLCYALLSSSSTTQTQICLLYMLERATGWRTLVPGTVAGIDSRALHTPLHNLIAQTSFVRRT